MGSSSDLIHFHLARHNRVQCGGQYPLSGKEMEWTWLCVPTCTRLRVGEVLLENSMCTHTDIYTLQDDDGGCRVLTG